ncbi:hypothetical protein [Salinibacter altiplanensis]|uniref:hypothetical protein n=1 Tax=Salinibacter altiplanensis TaxID=1803181 RepID=UPI000C9F1DB4|nr:hypothetical protein [Salinibacter altiplanensis]
MSHERPSECHVPHNLNWFGKTVYAGGALLRVTANLVDATADRVSTIAAESKKAFDRELDPNIEEAQVIEETPRQDPESDA